jgi:hypothetical protein
MRKEDHYRNGPASVQGMPGGRANLTPMLVPSENTGIVVEESFSIFSKFDPKIGF